MVTKDSAVWSSHNTQRKSWKERCQNVNSGGKITRDFFLSFSVYSTVLHGTDDSYNDMESRETGRESGCSHISAGGQWGVTPYLDAMLCVEVSSAQAGVEAVAQALQQPHSWEQLTFVLKKGG